MQVLLENSGYSVTVDALVGSGGFGEVRLHGSNQLYVVKKCDVEPEKLRYLVARPLVPSRSGHYFAWPSDIANEEPTGELFGYLMPKVEGGLDVITLFEASDWLPEGFLLRVAHNHIAAMLDLEKAGYRVGDLPNSMVLKDGTVVWVDLDSVQVSRSDAQFNCCVGKPATLPPELIGTASADYETTREHDAWSIAVVLWQLLMEDHPFSCRWVGGGKRPKLIDRIQQGIWPYSAGQKDAAPRRGSKPITSLDRDVQFLFRKTFEAGHSNPSQRPSLQDWDAAIERIDPIGPVTLSDREWKAVEQCCRPAFPLPIPLPIPLPLPIALPIAPQVPLPTGKITKQTLKAVAYSTLGGLVIFAGTKAIPFVNDARFASASFLGNYTPYFQSDPYEDLGYLRPPPSIADGIHLHDLPVTRGRGQTPPLWTTLKERTER